jgi:hypothetical protein
VAVIVMLPVGLVAAVIDQVLVIPVAESDDAYRDTKAGLWEHFDFEEHYVTEMALMPFRLVATPLVFVGDLLLRTIFDLPAHPRDGESAEGTSRAVNVRLDEEDEFWAEHPDAESAAEADPLAELRAAIDAGDTERALALVEATWEIRDDEARASYEALVIAAATRLDLMGEQRAELIARENWRYVDETQAAARLERLRPLLTHAEPVVRRAGMKVLWRGFPQGDAWVASLARDRDPFVRLQWLLSVAPSSAAQTQGGKLAEPFLAEVQRLASGDDEIQVRVEAKNLLRLSAPK